jgi:PAS domain S-box-containing protein
MPWGSTERAQKRRLQPRAFLAMLAAAWIAAGGAWANTESPWRGLSDKVFQLVARNADLPDAVIPFSMTQDGSGFLWLGGDTGLLRWDGYQFRDYRPDPTLPNGLLSADVYVLHRDPRGQLWVGTTSGGLARYDAAQQRLLCVGLASLRCDGQKVWSIADDGAGGLWVATGAGLFRLDANGKTIGQWHHLLGRDATYADDAVLAVLRDHNGDVWIGSVRGLARSVGGKSEFTAVTFHGDQMRSAANMLEDSAGRIWIGTRQEGAFVISADRTQARSVAATAPSRPGEIATEITTLLEISPGRMWLGTFNRGIVEVDSATLHTQRIVHDPFVPDSLAGDSVQSLYRDNSGLVWVGTADGLSQYDPGASGIMTFFGAAGRRDGLSSPSIMSVLAAPDGSLWAGLQGDGFVVLDPSGRRAAGLAGYRIFAMTPAPTGGVLLGTDGGLFLADASGRHVQRLQIPEVSATVDVRAVRNVNGAVWLARRDGGLWKLQVGADGKVSVLQQEAGNRLTNNVVDSIAGAPDGRIAIGTDQGFNLLDPATDSVERIVADPSQPGSLDPGWVPTFTSDRHGRLWVGTSNGLDILEGRDDTGRPRFRRLGTADGLPNASIDSLQVDRKGQIWASTDNGLAVIDPETFKVRALQRADGVAITNFWSDSGAVMTTGEVVFGGVGGVTMVAEGAVETWHFRPPVVITAARVGGKPETVGAGPDTTLVVPADGNSLALEFASLDFSAPASNRFSYRLEGFDSGWTETDAAHRVAAYTNLPPGKYQFRLRGSNRNGLWTEPDTALGVQVLPAWYQTLWFRLAAAAGVVLLLLALMRGSTAILRRRQRYLERQVAERTAELSISQLKLQNANAGLERRVAERTHALAERTQALESSEARFRAWFSNAEDAVFVVQVEPDGRFIYEAVNAAVERIFGIPAATFLGRQPQDVWQPDAAAGMLGRYIEAAKGEPVQFETRMVLQSGERLLDTWIVPVRNPATGRVERLVGASRDMTERSALEARLAQAQKLQALGGLAGGIAHDFNNILQAVAGAAVLIEQAPEDHDKVQRLARSTIAAAERGTSITKRLLAFARSDDLRVEAMATAEVLEGLHEVLTYTLGSSIAVRTTLAPGLPPLLADRGQLETALVNLGTNARDAMPAGGVLTISAKPVVVREGEAHQAELAPGAYVRIDVTDTGTGMDTATQARAVEPFFTTKPQGQGTGLGLALVKGFTEQSGGGMAIQSALGAGTTVSLWLRQAPANVVHGPVQTGRTRRPETSSARILVVDDDDLVRETVTALLEGAGFCVAAAACGADGVALIETGDTPDALLCDLSMPGMNGIETIKRARELLPGLPCFLLTGYAGERAALENGDAFTLLRKPISASALIAQLEAGLAAEAR